MLEYANYTLKEHYLLLEAGGSMESFMELMGGTDRINHKALEMNATKILANFSNVSFDVKLPDAFNLVRYYEKKAQGFKNMHIAGVMNAQDIELGKFYESICNKRGFNASIFTTFQQAHNWLVAQ